MAQTRPICKFCGASGSSKEDIIAKWIGRLLSEGAPPGTHYVFHQRFTHPDVGIPDQAKTANLPAVHTRAFCKGCNEGWMGKLEEHVKPILEPLILGKSATLSIDEQQLLAFWATKTLLGFQAREDMSTTWARPADYVELHKLQAPLPNSQVWLGASEHKGGVAQHYAHDYRLNESEDDQIDGFGAALTIGHAVFYFAIGYTAPLGLRLRYAAALALKQIWPSTRDGLHWPPTLKLPRYTPMELTSLVVLNSVIVPQ
jgi:hypothetical protein